LISVGTATKPPRDCLSHDDLACSLISHLTLLPRGSVIAVQGSWGRGKTDILARISSTLAQASLGENSPRPAWINPWQYGAPDLLSPLVLELIERVRPEDRKKSAVLRDAAQTLLRVGSAIAIQGASISVPVLGPLMAGAAAPVDDFIKSLFDDAAPETPRDPIKAMADAFRQLVDQYLMLTNSTEQQLVVLVDDLDRCLPDHQIAILESIHFLTSAGANCHFLIAIDPQLVEQAAVSHYKVRSFDTEQFLDKLFDLRISLQYLRSEQTLPLFRELVLSSLDKLSASQIDRLLGNFANVFIVPAVNNPRVITRVVRRVQLLISQTNDRSWLNTEDDTFALLSWACICERWASLRIVFQVINTRTIDHSSLFELFSGISDRYSGRPERHTESRQLHRPIMERLPVVEREPDLGTFLINILSQSRHGTNDADKDWLVGKWVQLDAKMRQVAL
jgi:hypothetical protein